MKTYKGWNEVGGTFDDYAKPGDKIDQEMFYYFLGVVPPIEYRNGFLMGEPMSFNSEGKTTFMAFISNNKGYYYRGIMSEEEFLQLKEVK